MYKRVKRRQYYRRLKQQREHLKQILYESDRMSSSNTVQLTNSKYNNVDLFIDNMLENQTLLNDNLVMPLEIDKTACNLDIINNFVGELNNAMNSVSDMPNNSKTNYTLCDKLRHWAVTSKPTHNSVTKLLHILSPLHPDLPLDCRTLLRTPTKIKVDILDTGKYCNLGLFTALEHFLTNNPTFSSNAFEHLF